jgi:hypothetical protein
MLGVMEERLGLDLELIISLPTGAITSAFGSPRGLPELLSAY